MEENGPFIEWSAQPDGSEMASKVVSLACITTMAALLGIKTFNVQYRYLTYSRWLVIALYVISWSFCTSAIILMSTNNGNYISCFLSIMSCDIFYAGTKLLIYAWLIEKVWIVSAARGSRWRTIRYRIHIFLMTPYIGIITLMILFHVVELSDTGICTIGLLPYASIPLMTYDFVFNLYFTALFIRPLLKYEGGLKIKWQNTRLHDVALRTLAASVVCLFISFANVLVLAVMNGRQRGVVCLTCCTVDVTINVVTIHWVTSVSSGRPTKEQPNHHSLEAHHGNDNRDQQPHHDAFSPAAIVAAVGTHAPPGLHQVMDIDEYISNLVSSEELAGRHATKTMQSVFDKYNYQSSRFVVVGSQGVDEDLGLESRPPSLSESHNSRKSLTKISHPPSYDSDKT